MTKQDMARALVGAEIFDKLVAKCGGEAMACQFEDGDDLVEATKELVRERDEARASAADAYRRGAGAMREACIGTACAQDLNPDAQDRMEEHLRALPISEEP